ncbi:MAG: restriction endonuclease subunit S [Coprococcus sp.]
MNTPKIRFKGFKDDWEQRKLSELTTMHARIGWQNLRTSEFLDSGDYMLITGTDFQEGVIDYSTCHYVEKERYDQDKNIQIKNGSILITKDGTLGKVAYVQGLMMPATLNAGVFNVTIKNENIMDGKYLFQYLKAPFLMDYVSKKATGGTIKHLNQSILVDFPVAMPKREEQVKISRYFTALDNLITLHQRKCDETKQLKKFMLQKMFPKNGEKNPEIRFEGFTDDWEQRKLSEICERITRKNRNNESDLPLTIASQFGLIDQRDFFNKVVAAKDMSNYYLLKKGEFAYNKSYSNGFDYGSIKRLNAYKQGCLSTLYICFGITSDEVESDYLECFFDTLKWYGDLSMICAEGARNHGLLNVDTKGFFDEVTVDLPKSLEEQKRISVYMNALNRLITLHQRKCEKLKELKKYMLHNMFV